MKNKILLNILSAIIIAVVVVIFIIDITRSIEDVYVLTTNSSANHETKNKSSYLHLSSKNLRLVAHAGGGINGFIGSNSLEAMQNSVDRGLYIIELDILKTLDGRVVLNHSWETRANRVPMADNNIEDYETFMSRLIFNKFTPVDLAMLIEFLQANPHVRIITDTKATDYFALYAIANMYTQYIYRFWPQAYSFDDIERIRSLGFDNIIVTLYMMPPSFRYNPAEVGRLAREHDIFALVFAESLATREYVASLGLDDIKLFVHTVDSIQRFNELLNMGIYGVFTAFLAGSYPYIYNWFDIELAEMLAQASCVVSALTYDEQAQLAQVLQFKINRTYFFENAKPRLVGSQERMSAPFIHDNSIYLPLRYTASFLGGQNYMWHPQLRAVSLDLPDGTRHYFSQGNSGIKLYHDSFFASLDVFYDLFDAEIMVYDDIITVFR